MSQSGLGSFFYDVSELCELQWQLLKTDGTKARRSAVPALACLSACSALVLVATMLLALSMSWAFHEVGQLSLTVSFLISGFVLAIFAAVAAWLGIRGLTKTAAYFAESRTELNENIRWLRGTLLNPDSPRNQMALRQSESVQQAPPKSYRDQ